MCVWNVIESTWIIQIWFNEECHVRTIIKNVMNYMLEQFTVFCIWFVEGWRRWCGRFSWDCGKIRLKLTSHHLVRFFSLIDFFYKFAEDVARKRYGWFHGLSYTLDEDIGGTTSLGNQLPCRSLPNSSSYWSTHFLSL